QVLSIDRGKSLAEGAEELESPHGLDLLSLPFGLRPFSEELELGELPDGLWLPADDLANSPGISFPDRLLQETPRLPSRAFSGQSSTADQSRSRLSPPC